MKKTCSLIAGLAFLLVSQGLVSAQEIETITENGFISGSMNIDFATRKNLDTAQKFVDGSPALGSSDIYSLNLTVAKTTEFAGKVTRQPRLVSRIIGKEVQPAQLSYDIALAVRNPKDLTQKKAVGKWVGTVSIDKNGVYDFGSGDPTSSQLRMAVDAVGKAQAFVGAFGGRVFGKGEEKKGLLTDKVTEYSRLVQGKKVKIVVKKSDPLTFSNLILGEGPAQVYPRTVVNGNLDYDYETGNWYTNGIRFKYTANGTETEDLVTGSIKWVEDANRSSNGKGHYELNLRFNEDKFKTPSDEGAVFSGSESQSEDAFFAVDNSVPSMTGSMTYEDTFARSSSADEPRVVSSKVAYSLNANKLTKQQAMNFFKLWMLIVGPTNDE